MSNKIGDIRAIRALIGNVCVKSGKNVFQIFLNIYIWKQTQDIQIVAIFNIIYLSTHMVFFTLFAPIVKKGFRKILNIFSLSGFAGVYLWIMYLGENSLEYIYIIPAAIGFFNSVYWITYHNTQFEITTHQNRGNYEGIRKSLRMFSSIVVPFFVGMLISLDIFGFGYQVAFAFGASLFLLGAFVGAVPGDTEERSSYHLSSAFKKCFKIKEIRRSLATYSLTSFSFSNSVIEVLIPIILFSYLGSELEIGSAISFFAIVSIVTSYIFGKFVDYKDYPIYILLLGALYALALSGFVFSQEIAILLIVATAINSFAHLFSLPQKVISDNVLHKLEGYKNMRSEYMVIREWFQAIGWITSFALIYSIGNIDVAGVQIIFSVMIGAVIISSVFLSRISIIQQD